MDKVTEITSLNEIPKTGKVVIDFYAIWCGPCKKLGPFFGQLSLEFPDITFLKVNTDDAEDLTKHFDISALPTVLFINNGEVLSIVKGFNPDVLKSEMNELQANNDVKHEIIKDTKQD